MWNYKNLVKIFTDLSRYESEFRNRYFPAKAFKTAAEMIDSSDSYEIDDQGFVHFQSGRLGTSSSQIFIEYINNGYCSRLKEYQFEYGYLENKELMNKLMKIPGIGEVKAEVLSKHFNSLDDFMKLNLKVGEVIPGTNLSFTEMMSTGIEMLKITKGKRLPWVEANKLANKIIYSVASKVDFDYYTYKLGSLRRHKDTVGDIDLVVSNCDSSKFDELRNKFLEVLDKIFVNGNSKISGIKDGFQVDVRFIETKYLGCHLLHGTGSQEFNVKMRAYAKSIGLKLNEYCITLEDGTEKCFSTELEVFNFLKLKYVPPKYR